MNMLNEEVKLTLVQAPVADGQTDLDSARVDMEGFDGVMFIGSVGAITGDGTAKIEIKQADTDIAGTALDGANATATAAADSNKLLVIDIIKPSKRYLCASLTRAVANSVWGGTVALQYSARSKPTVQAAAQLAADVVALVSPEEVTG